MNLKNEVKDYFYNLPIGKQKLPIAVTISLNHNQNEYPFKRNIQIFFQAIIFIIVLVLSKECKDVKE